MNGFAYATIAREARAHAARDGLSQRQRAELEQAFYEQYGHIGAGTRLWRRALDAIANAFAHDESATADPVSPLRQAADAR